LTFSAYADLFNFPWLKYRVDAPSNGADYLLRLDWRPDKSFQFESRFRFNRRFVNDSLHALARVEKLSWRNQLKFAISAIWELRSRLELNTWRAENGLASNGFLTNMDIFYHPPKSCISLNSRLEWFETDDYNSRAYTYENDLPYYYYIPVLYGSGCRYYLNIMISYHSKITTGLKWAQTVYSGVTETGSGWDEVKGKKRSDLRAELLIKF